MFPEHLVVNASLDWALKTIVAFFFTNLPSSIEQGVKHL